MREYVFRDVLRRFLALVPRLERYEDRRRVGLVGAGDDVEPSDEEHVLDRGIATDHLLHGGADILRALQVAPSGSVTEPMR